VRDHHQQPRGCYCWAAEASLLYDSICCRRCHDKGGTSSLISEVTQPGDLRPRLPQRVALLDGATGSNTKRQEGEDDNNDPLNSIIMVKQQSFLEEDRETSAGDGSSINQMMMSAATGESTRPVTLSQMAIGSVDTLRGRHYDLSIPSGWNERPPLLQLNDGNGMNKQNSLTSIIGRGAAAAVGVGVGSQQHQQQPSATEETPVLLKGVRGHS